MDWFAIVLWGLIALWAWADWKERQQRKRLMAEVEAAAAKLDEVGRIYDQYANVLSACITETQRLSDALSGVRAE